MIPTMSDLSRRQALIRGLCAASTAGGWAEGLRAHASFGAVSPPVALPDMPVMYMDGTETALSSALKGQATAMQLMYTGCSATCPIQGAMFAQLQQRLVAAGSHVRLVSVSIDPRGDDRASLKSWLGRHGAQAARWTALLPKERDVPRLMDMLKGRAQGADRHTPQVYILDRQARLTYRTEDMPSVDAVMSLLRVAQSKA